MFENLFRRYRNGNRNKSINHGQFAQPQPEDENRGPFGAEAERKNPNLRIFSNAQNNIADIVDRRSVVTRYQPDSDVFDTEDWYSSIFDEIQAVPIFTNKPQRIRQYRAMARYSECNFCLSEIADDVLHEDETGQSIRLTIPTNKKHLDSEKRTILQLQFDKFVELFKFKDDSFWMVKKLLVEGELAYENIINPDKPELGIIGVKYLPTEYYDTVVNGRSIKTMGIVFNKEQLNVDLRQIVSSSCLGSRCVFNNMVNTQPMVDFNIDNLIPLLWPQLTYISFGQTSEDGLITYPIMEYCREPYHQLALMKDAAVILRVTRAPERLLFNINTGKVPDKVARQRIKNFANDLKSKRIVSPSNHNGNGQADITTVYNPVSMLETYFFGKSDANDGTTVESVGSTADYEQIADIEFFLRALFKAFKVPFSRYKAPENSLERDETISYEEYSMARMVIRIQRKMAMGLKRSFITHLKLIGLWKTYQLKESDFSVDFNAPILYDLYQTQKKVTAMMDTYKSVVDQEELSKIDAMKRILKMTDEQIDQNFLNLIKEKQLVALADYYADKISDENRPLDFKSPIRLSGDEGQTEETGGAEGGAPEEEGPPEVPEAPEAPEPGEEPPEPPPEEGENEERPLGLG